jgi:hypothetical protein
MPSSLADGYKGMWITSYTVPRVTQLGFWGKSLWELIPPTGILKLTLIQPILS